MWEQILIWSITGIFGLWGLMCIGGIILTIYRQFNPAPIDRKYYDKEM